MFEEMVKPSFTNSEVVDSSPIPIALEKMILNSRVVIQNRSCSPLLYIL